MGSGVSRERMEEYQKITDRRFNPILVTGMYEFFQKRARRGGLMGLKEFIKYLDGLPCDLEIGPLEAYEELFRGFDVDGDGLVSFKDFLLLRFSVWNFSKTYNFQSHSALMQNVVFAMYDKDGDGYISREEFMALTANDWRRRGEDVESSEVQNELSTMFTDLLIRNQLSQKEDRISKDDFFTAASRNAGLLNVPVLNEIVAVQDELIAEQVRQIL